ncbi:porin [Cribrihabitans neustonicus]|uniref:porin n=1 Tax=Cribrihabitans neustonicus TaxID=1429085 RepID=UPI003B59F282
MKKILFASTALIAAAGAAAAQGVEFNGYGRFGIGYLEDRAVAGTSDADETIIVSRLRINIDAETETDGGVQFGARIRLQADEAGNGEGNGGGLNAPRFHVAFGGLRVEVGNVAGALDNLPGYYGFEPGLENFVGQYSGVNYSFVGYGSDGAGDDGATSGTQNAVYARWALGDFAVAASYDAAPDLITTTTTGGTVTTTTTGGTTTTTQTGGTTTTTVTPGADRWDIHFAYSFGNVTAALGYGETDNATDDDITVLTLQSDFGPFSTVLFVGDESVGNNAAISDTFYGVSASYELSAATSVNFAYGDGSGSGDTQNVGIGAIHDLGGGVSLRGGIGRSKTGNGASQNRADFGAQFSF